MIKRVCLRLWPGLRRGITKHHVAIALLGSFLILGLGELLHRHVVSLFGEALMLSGTDKLVRWFGMIE